ncbi:ammonia channel precursor [bacterium BMS3Abin14]|nr:ammonia channel precursor [bacterium BMS3Abin14]
MKDSGHNLSRIMLFIFTTAFLSLISSPAFAGALDSGDTAWVLTSTALVLFMTIPGLSLFYGGLVRTKNVLSVLMQCFAITCVVTVLWVIGGYSIAFSANGSPILNGWFGGLSKGFLLHVGRDSMIGGIPETVFVMFQLTFAIITPALIIGSFAERMRFSAMLLFSAIWSIVVYAPVAHWVWGGGWLQSMGVMDFAGGIVVHINAGVAGLVTALYLGKRKGYPKIPMPPHSLTLSVVGAGMLWVGWFGFNGGSALAADTTAGMAILVTQISSATAACAWMLVEWIRYGKPSVLGIITGAVAGLATITPASGFVGPGGAIIIGAIAGVACFFTATSIKRAFGYDDSLDAFGVHGVGGYIGSILTGVFGASVLGGSMALNIGRQVGVQILAAVAVTVYCAVLSWIILKVVDSLIHVRVENDDELMGLDLTDHNEKGYDY